MRKIALGTAPLGHASRGDFAHPTARSAPRNDSTKLRPSNRVADQAAAPKLILRAIRSVPAFLRLGCARYAESLVS